MRGDPTPRREALRKILSDGEARTQADLASALAEAGFPTTQATISRDLRALGTMKAAGKYALPHEAGNGSGTGEAGLLAGALLDVRSAGDCLVVLQTGTGSAQRAALAIDRMRWPEVVGTIAGDDTIFVATASRKDQRELLRRLTALRRGEGA